MHDTLELKGILKYIFQTLNKTQLNIKDVTNILFLIEWEFVKLTNYRLFYYKWTNDLESNIKLIRQDINNTNLNILINNKYELIYLCDSDYKLTTYMKKAIDSIKDYDLLLAKTEFYFLEKLPFDLFYNVNCYNVKEIDIEILVKRKENKEY